MSDTTSIVVGAVSAAATALSGMGLVVARRRWATGDRREQTTDGLRDELQQNKNAVWRANTYVRNLRQDVIVAHDAMKRKVPGWEVLIARLAAEDMPNFMDEPTNHEKPRERDGD